MSALAPLFETQRNTRNCWCTAFCATRTQFAIGWFSNGNRHRFEALAADSPMPMGVLALVAGEPVGWCACGPRSRYRVATSGQDALRNRSPAEDESVWLVACLFVRAGQRGQGVTAALVRAAVDLARQRGAAAVEGWPAAGPEARSGDAFMGREQLFDSIGFRCVERPLPHRAIMRLELTPAGAP